MLLAPRKAVDLFHLLLFLCSVFELHFILRNAPHCLPVVFMRTFMDSSKISRHNQRSELRGQSVFVLQRTLCHH